MSNRDLKVADPPPLAIEIIEKAKNYFVLSKAYLEKPIYVGSRKKLAKVLSSVDPDMIIATYGTSRKCIIVMDYSLGQLMDLIAKTKDSN